jgi:uroporphyrinogen decarboxylase
MKISIERVRAVLRGEAPDRPPLYDLLRNDAVISHFAGTPLTVENAARVVYDAYEPALDATRPAVRMPDEEKTVVLEDGRKQRHFRWTTWTEHVVYPDAATYAAAKRAQVDAFDPVWNAEKQNQMDDYLVRVAEERHKLGEVFFFPGGPGLGLMGIIGEVGIEAFCYYLVEYPDTIETLLDCHTEEAVAWIEHLPDDHGIEAVFSGDDMAFKNGPMLWPTWFESQYFPRMARVMDAYHARGIKVLFHSDGDLNPLLDGLVQAGIDGLNPIEVLAGMDVGVVHRRYPHLFLCGGIDVSQLLPYGTPQQVKEAVGRAVDAAEGRLMVGSSTELNNEVPLENYLALRKAVLEYG